MYGPHFLAQTVTPSSAPTTQGTSTPPAGWDLLSSPMFPLMVVLVIFWLWATRSKKNQEKQRTDMLDNLKKGDRVQTIGGILGSVVEVRDGEVVVKVDETSNTKIKFTRSAIHRVVTEEKAEK